MYYQGVNGINDCPLNRLIPIWLILGFVLFFPISCIQMKFRVEHAIRYIKKSSIYSETILDLHF
jgi:hypothetical protein